MYDMFLSRNAISLSEFNKVLNVFIFSTYKG